MSWRNSRVTSVWGASKTCAGGPDSATVPWCITWTVWAARRAKLKEALLGAGFTIDHSEASLYLWASRGEDCWDTVGALAERGILVAPGAFYGRAGAQHVRVAFTATDERVDAAIARLRG